jgi:hypothetical protein
MLKTISHYTESKRPNPGLCILSRLAIHQNAAKLQHFSYPTAIGFLLDFDVKHHCAIGHIILCHDSHLKRMGCQAVSIQARPRFRSIPVAV